MNGTTALKQLAEHYGIELEYFDASGAKRAAGEDSITAVLTALGVDLARGPAAAAAQVAQPSADWTIEPAVVAWDGRLSWKSAPPAGGWQLRLESGESHSAASLDQLPRRLAFGYHELTLTSAEKQHSALIISAPARAFQPEHGPEWGVFLPLYAVQSSSNYGIGDYRALRELLRFTGQHGGGYVATLPLLAAYLDEPFEPSPYSPVSRLFWNELFIDLEAALTLLPCSAAGLIADAPGFRDQIDALNRAELIDYREVACCRRRLLEPLARCFFEAAHARDAQFKRFLELYPRVADYAAFRAATERRRTCWPEWPQRLRDGELQAEVDYDPHDADYHTFLQFVAHQQLERLGRTDPRPRLYLDLPVGVNGGGYDVWRFRDLFATGMSAGAPPDAFFTQGQNWGFPPLNPLKLRQDRFTYFREAVRTHLRYAGALRLDHVMGLHRLFWVPEGAEPADGVYVRYPTEELYAILSLESARHRALIVGEDLGTVAPEVRRKMDEHGVRRMYVVQFEADAEKSDPLPRVPPGSVASLNTHDMPTFAAFVQAHDAHLRAELGLITAAEAAQAQARREQLIAKIEGQLQRAGFLHHPAAPRELRDALLSLLAASDAGLLLINLEDLWNEERPQNVPGTAFERPNWRRVAACTLEHLITSPAIAATLRRLKELRSSTRMSTREN